MQSNACSAINKPCMHACSIKDLNNTGHNNLKRNQDTNIENFKMWIKTRLYFRYSCINEKNKTLIPAYVRSCMVTICTLAFQARTRVQSLVEPLKVLQ